VLEKDSLEFAALIEVTTASFEKMKKLSQEELDRKTAELMRTDAEIDTFVEKTKNDCENLVKTLEGNED